MIEISTNKRRLDIVFIHAFLTDSYWAEGRTKEEVITTVKNSLNFGVYLNDNQIGFARVVTDYTVFCYLMDVFIIPQHRGKGYSKILLDYIFSYPKLRNCKGWLLKTLDAHELYEKFEFKKIKHPELLMERITNSEG